MKEQVVKEWFERAKHDLEVSKILLDEEDYFGIALVPVMLGVISPLPENGTEAIIVKA